MTPQAESVLELFRSTGAYLQGHFRLTSGLHSAEYLQSALVLQHPAAAEKLGRLLAEELHRMVDEKIGLVVSPALGGVSNTSRPFGRASTQPNQVWFFIVFITENAYWLLSKLSFAVDA